MNTHKNTEKSLTEVRHYERSEVIPASAEIKAAIPDSTLLMHEAEIITPQPYGVFALCKILEHFQIN